MEALSYFWNDGVGATSAVGADQTFTGGTHGPGASPGQGVSGINYFNAFFLSDQGGTAHLQISQDGANWYDAVPPQTLTGGAPLTLTSPMLTGYFRAELVNGGTPQTYLWVNTSMTGA